MGTIESIAVVVLIGFSVDYIIHFSADYMHSLEETRELKM
jgi:predicted RND superfamily exporter protein